MSGPGRPAARAAFRIGPWVPGVLLPIAVGVVGVAGALLVLQDLLLPVGLALAVGAAVRVRSAAPWLLTAMLALGQLLRDPARLAASLPALLLVVHLLVVLTLLARAVPVASRLQLAALGSAARTLVLVQLPAQALAVLLLAADGRLRIVPVAAVLGGLLLALVAGLLVVPRTAQQEEGPGEGAREDDPRR